MEEIPPIKDALKQHIKQAIYQRAHCWGNIPVVAHIPSPEDWRWVNPDIWKNVDKTSSDQPEIP